jgi:hypothetical protein
MSDSQMNSLNSRSRFLSALAWSGVLAAILLLVATGIAGIGRHGAEPFADVQYWYVATDMWLNGADPYDQEQFVARSVALGAGDIAHYPYPPLSFWFGLGLQGSSYAVAKWIWVGLNLMALVALIAAARRFLAILQRSTAKYQWVDFPPLAAFSILLLGSPYTSNVIWAGQTALLCTAALSWAWILVYDTRFPLLGGVLLAMGAAKPQIAMLLGVWLLIDRRWLALAGAATFALVLCAVPLNVSGLGLIAEWLNNTRLYLAEPSQSTLFSHNLNIKSVALGLGAAPGLVLSGTIVAAGAAMFFLLRSKLTSSAPDSVVAYSILIPLSVLTLWGRDYDLAACSGLLLLGIHLTYLQPSRAWIVLPAIVALYVPHRLVEKLGIPLLTYWRPCLMVAGIVCFLMWYLRDRKQALLQPAP